MTDTDRGIKQTKVIINFRYGAHGGAGIVAGRALFDGDGRRQPLNRFDIWFVHLSDKLTGIRGKRFHITSLAFGIDGVKANEDFQNRSRR